LPVLTKCKGRHMGEEVMNSLTVYTRGRLVYEKDRNTRAAGGKGLWETEGRREGPLNLEYARNMREVWGEGIHRLKISLREEKTAKNRSI